MLGTLDTLNDVLPAAGTYDRAFLVTVLGEVPDGGTAMRALHGALRAGGLLAVTEALPDPDYQSPRTVRGLAVATGFELASARVHWFAFTTVFRKPR